MKCPEPHATDSAALPTHGLAADLQNVMREANGMPIRIERLLDVLSERGNAVAIVLLAAPFVVIPIPGVSTIMGVVILGLSLGVMFGSRPWLPGFVRRRELSPGALSKIAGGTRWVLGKFQRFVRPRVSWATDKRLHWLIGASLIAGTVALALPIPIPGNNIPPAIGVLLLALGLAERDGLLVIVGHVYTFLLWAVLIVLTIVFWEGVNEYVIAKLSRSEATAT